MRTFVFGLPPLHAQLLFLTMQATEASVRETYVFNSRESTFAGPVYCQTFNQNISNYLTFSIQDYCNIWTFNIDALMKLNQAVNVFLYYCTFTDYTKLSFLTAFMKTESTVFISTFLICPPFWARISQPLHWGHLFFYWTVHPKLPQYFPQIYFLLVCSNFALTANKCSLSQRYQNRLTRNSVCFLCLL